MSNALAIAGATSGVFLGPMIYFRILAAMAESHADPSVGGAYCAIYMLTWPISCLCGAFAFGVAGAAIGRLWRHQ